MVENDIEILCEKSLFFKIVFQSILLGLECDLSNLFSFFNKNIVFMKKILKYLFLVFILTSCKKKNNLQYEKLYGDVKEVLISDYSNLTDTNDYLKGQKPTLLQNWCLFHLKTIFVSFWLAKW